MIPIKDKVESAVFLLKSVIIPLSSLCSFIIHRVMRNLLYNLQNLSLSQILKHGRPLT